MNTRAVARRRPLALRRSGLDAYGRARHAPQWTLYHRRQAGDRSVCGSPLGQQHQWDALYRALIHTTGASPNGVLGRILVGDAEVWQQFVGPGPTSPLAFQTLVDVQVGDAVNFLLEPFESNDSNDATDFVVQLCR